MTNSSYTKKKKYKGGVVNLAAGTGMTTDILMKNLLKKDSGKKTEETPVSNSKAKRTERKNEIKKEKRNHTIIKIVWIVILCAAVGALVFYIGRRVYKYANKTTASGDFSTLLNDDGTIKNVKVSSAVTLCSDYKTVPVAKKDVTLSDKEIESKIKEQLDSHKTLVKTSKDAVKKGDVVNIDYVGKVNGKAFDGGSAKAYDLTIGSNSFIEGFEDQLIGHKIGEKVEVKVTFPKTYQATNLAGKAAVFDVTVNGYEVDPEFNDAFVKQNLSEYADTADGYRKYLKADYYKIQMDTAVDKYIAEKSKISRYPHKYVKHLKSLQKYKDESTFTYMNQMYNTYYGYTPYATFNDYTGKTDDEYEKSLIKTAKEQAAKDMIYQEICAENNIKVTSDDYLNYLVNEKKISNDNAKKEIETEGKGYGAQQMLKVKALELIEKTAVVK